MAVYKKQEQQQVNDWGYASAFNRAVDNIDAIVGGDVLKESVNSASTRVDALNNALNTTLTDINQTLEQTQTSVRDTTDEFVQKMEQLKTDTETTVQTVITAIDKVKDTTGEKVNLYPYFNNDAGNERRNLVQMANKLLDMIGYDKNTNRSIEDIDAQIKQDDIVKTLNKINTFLGIIANLTTTNRANLTVAINELDSDIGDKATLTTTAKNNTVSAINELDKEIGSIDTIDAQIKQNDIVATLNKINTLIGTLTALTTAAKTSLVLAINELDKEIGGLDTLTTDNKNTIVNAINSLKTNLTTLDGEVVKSATLDGVNVTKNTNQLTITLPKATDTTQGAVTIGAGITVTNGKISTSKNNIGLGNVDNTSDINKPISTATQTALDAKVDNSKIETTLSGTAGNIVDSAAIKSELDKKQDKLTFSGALQNTANTITIDQSKLTDLAKATDVGDVTTLTTTNKTIVEAINELKQSIDALTP